MAQMEKGKTCGACHDDKHAFTVAENCNRCHKGVPSRMNWFFKSKGINDAVSATSSTSIWTISAHTCHVKLFPYKG